MRFGSLFAGIGGFDLGLERAGMKCAWQVELDPFCLKILAKHWPDVPKYRDIKDVGGHNLEPVELICGGWPCQPFSVAGKQRGAEDDRHLWPQMFRVIQEVRPTWFLGENVPGIIRMELDTVLSDLEGAGYETQTFNIGAVSVDAPHRRMRVFVVGYNPNAFRNAKRTAHGKGGGERGRGREVTNFGIWGPMGSHVGDIREDVPDSLRVDADGSGHGTGQIRGEQREEAGIQGCEDVGNATSKGLPNGRRASVGSGEGPDEESERPDCPRRGLQDVADPDRGGLEEFREAHHEDGSDAHGDISHGCGEDVAHANGEGLQGRGCGELQECACQQSPWEGDTSRNASHANRSRKASGGDGGRVGREGEPSSYTGIDEGGRGGIEPKLRRMDDGLPKGLDTPRLWGPEWEGVPRVARGVKNRVDRLRTLGNAVVVPLIQMIGEMVMEAHKEHLDAIADTFRE